MMYFEVGLGDHFIINCFHHPFSSWKLPTLYLSHNMLRFYYEASKFSSQFQLLLHSLDLFFFFFQTLLNNFFFSE